MKIKYTSDRGILLTRCPLLYSGQTGVNLLNIPKVGSYNCTQCTHFKSIDRDNEIVECEINNV